MRHTNIIASYLVLFDGNKVLLSQRHNTGYHDGNYSVVAGHVEPGETFTQTVIREAKEEAGIDLDTDTLYVAHTQHRKSDLDDSERVHIYFVAEKWAGEITNCEEDKCSGLSWFDLDDLPTNMVPCVRESILNIRNKKPYSEFGWLGE
jgi:8-oxo-dGTP pyrophosphatase MutT (NUDIX family)